MSEKLKIIGYSKELYGKCDNCGTLIKHEFHISDGRILGCECASFIYGWNKGFSTPDSLRKEFEKRQVEEKRALTAEQRKAEKEKERAILTAEIMAFCAERGCSPEPFLARIK